MDDKVTSHVITVFSNQVEFLKDVINDLRKKLNEAEAKLDVSEMENSRLQDDVDELIESGRFYVQECKHLREFIDRINRLLPEGERMETYWSEVEYDDDDLEKRFGSLALGPKTTTESGKGCGNADEK